MTGKHKLGVNGGFSQWGFFFGDEKTDKVKFVSHPSIMVNCNGRKSIKIITAITIKIYCHGFIYYYGNLVRIC